VSLLLGVWLSCVPRAAGALTQSTFDLLVLCATALLREADEVAERKSRSHDTLCCTRGTPPTSTQGGRGARSPPPLSY
jgi:hypothetical protein